MSEAHPWNPPVRTVHVVPPHPGACFRCFVPEFWEQLPVLSEVPDFSDPRAFMLLGSFMAHAGSMLVTISGRPAHALGTPDRWMAHLCHEFGFHPVPGTTHDAPPNPTIIASCDATHATPRGPMPLRLVLLEDRGQWLLVTAMAVASRWNDFEFDLLRLLGSLEVTEPPKASTSQDIIPFPTPHSATATARSTLSDPPDRPHDRPLRVARL